MSTPHADSPTASQPAAKLSSALVPSSEANPSPAVIPNGVCAARNLSSIDTLQPERYELRSHAFHHFNLQRRDFFKVMGAGIAVFTVSANANPAQESGGRRQHRDDDQPKDISSWLHINDDGIVTVFTGKVEVGQNTRTTLSQSVADELRVPLESIR